MCYYNFYQFHNNSDNNNNNTKLNNDLYVYTFYLPLRILIMKITVILIDIINWSCSQEVK